MTNCFNKKISEKNKELKQIFCYFEHIRRQRERDSANKRPVFTIKVGKRLYLTSLLLLVLWEHCFYNLINFLVCILDEWRSGHFKQLKMLY